VRKIEILDGPGGSSAATGFIVIGGPFPFPEEDQFESKPFATRRGHITRVIPPFRAKVLMLEMISRKLILITGESFAILEAAAEQGENTQRKYKRPYG